MYGTHDRIIKQVFLMNSNNKTKLSLANSCDGEQVRRLGLAG